jgi:AAA-like domain
MSLSFNNAGPQIPGHHYTLDPLRRVKVADLMRLIENMRYFVLHAPRQTGKTSSLMALRDKLNAEGRYRALYVNVEGAKGLQDVQEAMGVICEEIARAVDETFPGSGGTQLGREIRDSSPRTELPALISRFSALDPQRPLVLFLDEADVLQGQAMVSFLSHLRSGYAKRPQHFPQCIILCGLRDIRDFRITDRDGTPLTTGSAFNILSDSLRLGNFSQEEIVELYLQHTAETGQRFTEEAMELVWTLTRGQPWMVNKLADLCCFIMEPGTDRSVEITADMIQAAREEMIQRRYVHLDQLTYRLSEDRVRRVIAPMLEGNESGMLQLVADDLSYCVDLGLVRIERGQLPQIANPIYREIIPREITFSAQATLDQYNSWYRHPDGRMDLPKLLTAFQTYYRAHSESDRNFPHYSEAGAQLLVQTWLQRIVNGGGQIEREYGLGMGRIDLLVRWPYPRPVQEMVIELKVVHPKQLPETVLAKGLEQIEAYMDRMAATEGHLMIFDQRPDVTWETKIWRREATTPSGKAVTVWGA